MATKKTPTKEAPAKKTLADHAKKLAETLAPAKGPVVEKTPHVVSVSGGHKAEVEFAKKNENKEYAYDTTQPESLVPLMRDAWNAVKGKDDAAYDDSAPAFRSDLLHHTIGVLTTSAVLRGDSYWARFENEVAKIKSINAK